MAEYEIKEGVGIIPAGSTEIKDEAFKGCEELKSVIIPDSVTKIGSHAFRWCSALTEINIPDSVTEIGRGDVIKSINSNGADLRIFVVENINLFYHATMSSLTKNNKQNNNNNNNYILWQEN